MALFPKLLAALLGAVFGSFACCQAWRLRTHDASLRSHCESCQHQLAWYDNIPILSWLFLRGRCRKCGHKIGFAEFFAELFGALAFSLIWLALSPAFALNQSPLFHGLVILQLLLAGALAVLLLILAIEDAKWQTMTTKIIFYALFVAFLFFLLSLFKARFLISTPFWPWCQKRLLSFLGALFILPGLYLSLYKLSHETLVGGGDYLIALIAAFVVADFWPAFFVLFLANLLGSLFALPQLFRSHQHRAQMRLPLVPFLALALLLVFSFNLIFKSWF